jgi:type 1 glutamine amidotransferase
MAKKALLVGGCAYTFHQLEPIVPHIQAVLARLGVELTATGIYHPNGGAEFHGDYSELTAENLAEYDLLVLYTTGNDRRGAEPDSIRAFVESGKALVGIHNATDSFTDDPAFVQFMGGRFRTHPAQLDITAEIVDAAHPITQGVPTFTVWDELYLFADYDPTNVHVLAQTSSYAEEAPVPVAWVREPGEGRLFYLSLGHNPATMENADWQRLFENGITWALRG